jgi:hypothetical protein
MMPHICVLNTLLRKGKWAFGPNMHLFLSVIAFPLIVTLLLCNGKLLNHVFFVYLYRMTVIGSPCFRADTEAYFTK